METESQEFLKLVGNVGGLVESVNLRLDAWIFRDLVGERLSITIINLCS